MRRLGLAASLRTGQAWDWKFRGFRPEHGAWVRVRLRHGQGAIVGSFGPGSVASANPRRRDLYLEETWTVDEEGEPVEAVGAGVWISGDEILSIEFFEEEE